MLVKFDLSIQLIIVVLLDFFALVYCTALLVLDALHILGYLVGVSRIILPQKSLLLLFLAHLAFEGHGSLIF